MSNSYIARASSIATQPTPPPPQPQPDNNLLKVFSSWVSISENNRSGIDVSLRSLFESGKYSDLVIKCQGQRWKAHRAVVCSQSRPLAAAIDGNFRVSVPGILEKKITNSSESGVRYRRDWSGRGRAWDHRIHARVPLHWQRQHRFHGRVQRGPNWSWISTPKRQRRSRFVSRFPTTCWQQQSRASDPIRLLSTCNLKPKCKL